MKLALLFFATTLTNALRYTDVIGDTDLDIKPSPDKVGLLKQLNIDRQNKIVDTIRTRACVDPGLCDAGTYWDAVDCACVGQCNDDDVPAGCTDQKIDIGFVIDGSGSVGRNNFAQMLHQIGEVIKGLEIGPNNIRVAAHSYSCSDCHTKQDAGFDLDAHYGWTSVENAIDNLKYHGSVTYTGSAFQHMFANVMHPQNLRPGAHKAIIVLTDGQPNPSAQRQVARDQAQAARAAGFKVFAIGVGGTYDIQNLKDMASQPYTDYVYELNNFDVAQFKHHLLTVLCDDDDTTTAVPAVDPVATVRPVVVPRPRPSNTGGNEHHSGGGDLENPRTEVETRPVPAK